MHPCLHCQNSKFPYITEIIKPFSFRLESQTMLTPPKLHNNKAMDQLYRAVPPNMIPSYDMLAVPKNSIDGSRLVEACENMISLRSQ